MCAKPWRLLILVDPPANEVDFAGRSQGGLMRAYVITTGALFGLLTIAHIVRIVLERRLVPDPVFILFTLLSAGLAIWAWRVLKS